MSLKPCRDTSPYAEEVSPLLLNEGVVGGPLAPRRDRVDGLLHEDSVSAAARDIALGYVAAAAVAAAVPLLLLLLLMLMLMLMMLFRMMRGGGHAEQHGSNGMLTCLRNINV